MDWDDYLERLWLYVIPSAIVCAIVSGIIGSIVIGDFLTPATMGVGIGVILAYALKLIVCMRENSVSIFDIDIEDFAEDHPVIYSFIITAIPFGLSIFSFILAEEDISLFLILIINVVAVLVSCGIAQWVGHESGDSIRDKFRYADGLREYASAFGEIFDRGVFAWLLHIFAFIVLPIIAYSNGEPEILFLPLLLAGLRFIGKVLLGIWYVIIYIIEEYLI